MSNKDAWVTAHKLAEAVLFDYENLPPVSSRLGENEFVENYDPSKYGLTENSVVYTADACVFTVSHGVVRVLLIKRGNHPYKSYWCLPGGFVDATDVDVAGAAVRELEEEAGVVGVNPVYVGVFDTPNRDPRMKHVVSTVFGFVIPEETPVHGSDDAAEAAWVPVEDVLHGNIFIGFDHILLVKEAIKAVYSLTA